jgi:hypothetical protein
LRRSLIAAFAQRPVAALAALPAAGPVVADAPPVSAMPMPMPLPSSTAPAAIEAPIRRALPQDLSMAARCTP